MLKYEILNRGIKERKEILETESLSYFDNRKEFEMIFKNCHHLNSYDNIFFSYGNGKYYEISYSKEIERLNDKEIKFSKFDDYQIFPSSVYSISNFSYNGDEKHALCFEFDNVKHDFFEMRNVSINEILNTKNDAAYEKVRRCPNDYVVCNNIFLLQASNVVDGMYIFNEQSIKNYRHNIYFYHDGVRYNLDGCLVPVFDDGNDNRELLYWEFTDDDSEVKNIIENNFYSLRFYTNDDRFIKNDKTLRDGVKIYKLCNTIDINIPIGGSFENNMNQRELIIDNFITKVVDENINEIVDMEKQIFKPVIVDGNGKTVCENVNKINFNFNILKREDWSENKYTCCEVNEENKEECISYRCVNNPSLLGEIGFNDDDVYYQKNCIKKSFIRLSFYDNPYRNRQSLLFYSTIFLDSGELYGKYTKNINRGFEKTEGNEMVSNNGDTIANFEPLECSLSISNAFNRMKSSEGYYLYLYPSLCKGNVPTTIYMKVEFNHAKYGYTIPLTAPSHNNYKTKGYIGGGEGTYSEQMNNLLNDLYIEVKIRYNKEENCYEWYVLDKGNENDGYVIKNNNYEITFKLYEPIVNYIKTNQTNNGTNN